jgi:hypothetical protein
LSRGRVSFKFSLQDSFPFVTLLLAGSCLHNKQAPDQPLIRCQLGWLSEEQCAQDQGVVVRYADVLTSCWRMTFNSRLPGLWKDPRIVLHHLKWLFLEIILRNLWLMESSSPLPFSYSSPMFLDPKGPDNFRAVVDYRLLNQRIEVESTPLPDFHYAFNWFANAKFFSTFDPAGQII